LFGIIANDFDDVSYNGNGIFKAEAFLNGAPSFGYQFDTLLSTKAVMSMR
jgi:hypothetical protein